MQVTTQVTKSKDCVVCKKFCGTEAKLWMCSVCYNEHKPPQEKKQPPKQQQKPDPQPDKTKCFKCSRKVGLLGTPCKCDLVFCKNHKMPEDHECSVDYRKLAEEKLKKQIGTLKHEKVQQI